MYGDDKELLKCYKCGFYHEQAGNYKSELRESKEKDHEGKFKLICDTCRAWSTRDKHDLRIGASFDIKQSIIIKDLAYRLRMLELENQGQQAQIERLENEAKAPKDETKKGRK